ncbi:MAG: hemerythrin domain-containing protein [Phycisphaeraceae bacterium]
MAKFKHAPIARHEALAPFSRDHYTGLVQAQQMMKAADADDVERRKAVAEFVDAWDREIAEHFADEEKLLLSLMNSDDRQRLFDDHRRLAGMADQARQLRRQVDPAPDLLRQIGQALEAHIRWEERELFVRLQNELSQEQLALLQHQTEPIEQARPRNTCRRGDHADEESPT